MTTDFRRSGVALIVVTYRSFGHLPDFLNCIPGAISGVDGVRVVVVDNDSDDGTSEFAEAHDIVSEVVQLGENLGYAAGINAGISHVPNCDAYFVLNPDVRLSHGCLETLLKHLEAPGIGICVPRLHDEHGQLLFSLRREPTILRELGEAILGGHRAGRWPLIGSTFVNPNTYEKAAIADWATGGAMLISGQCGEQVGPWDESFFLYEEEVDFSLRARDLGFSLAYVPGATATRIIGEGSSPELRALSRVNRIRLFRRRNGAFLGFLLHGVILFSELIRASVGRQESRVALKVLLREWAFHESPHRVISLATQNTRGS
jgi:N-acetylglucosaminyl-diphospho-decaprenol L-rhamnosyltransferase